jgi:hypothetical protein
MDRREPPNDVRAAIVGEPEQNSAGEANTCDIIRKGMPMARKPNYRFDRMERDRAKAAKRAERLKTKEEKAISQKDAEPTQENPEPAQEEGD